jgi:6-phosphogluconate dehydrogenase
MNLGMTTPAGEFGIVGLGRMGGGLALHARELGLRVVGADSAGLRADLKQAGIIDAKGLEGFRQLLSPPRAVFIYVPAGRVVDAVIDDVAAHLEPGDVIVDGGNSYWGDSIHRAARLEPRSIEFVDLGTSGGIEGARHGACFMVGGTPAGVQRIEPLLLELAVDGGYAHAGAHGAGHFAKLVHNGIEFGMLQAIGEGVALLEANQRRVDVSAVLSCWRHGSVIRSWLIDLMHEAYVKGGGLTQVPPVVEDTGEVNWLVSDALQMEVPIPAITLAVLQLLSSRDQRQSAARAVAMMRHGFGGHPYGRNLAVQEEREHGQVGSTYRE